jgi:hypothetical protein
MWSGVHNYMSTLDRLIYTNGIDAGSYGIHGRIPKVFVKTGIDVRGHKHTGF